MPQNERGDILAGNALELWTDGGEENNHGIIPRFGKDVVECERVELDNALGLCRLCLKFSDLFGDNVCRGLRRGGCCCDEQCEQSH